MTLAPAIPTPIVAVRVEPGLRLRLPRLVRGGVIVIDYFVTGRCGPPVGDPTVRIRNAPTGKGYVALAPVDGMPIVACSDLLALLARAGPTLRIGGLPFARHLAISLDLPELWIDFIDGVSSLPSIGLHP